MLAVEKDEVTQTTAFVDDLGADSLDMSRILLAVEETFEIDFISEGAANIVTVADAVEKIRFILEDV